MSEIAVKALSNDDDVVKNIEKLRDNFTSEMREKYENAKIGVGLDTLPDFLMRREFEYSDDFEVKKMSESHDGNLVVYHHLKVLNDFQEKIDGIRESHHIVKDFTFTSASVDIDYGDEDGEIEEYQICYEYHTLIETFNDITIGNHAKNHISDYLRNVLFEGTKASHKKSVSCADIDALLRGDVTVDTLRKIKYEICETI
jgi:hypothetical protein